ncbi:hypothetical protein Ndes2526B_g08670 [Nannochloris sp. 'desiccata']
MTILCNENLNRLISENCPGSPVGRDSKQAKRPWLLSEPLARSLQGLSSRLCNFWQSAFTLATNQRSIIDTFLYLFPDVQLKPLSPL